MPINSSGTSRAASQNAARRHLAVAACAACEHSPPLLSVMPRQPEKFLKLCVETDRSAGGSAELTPQRLVASDGYILGRSHARVIFQMEAIMLGTILLVILILLLIGALPTWPHSAGWGYYPSGGLGLVVIIILILLLLGRI